MKIAIDTRKLFNFGIVLIATAPIPWACGQIYKHALRYSFITIIDVIILVVNVWIVVKLIYGYGARLKDQMMIIKEK